MMAVRFDFCQWGGGGRHRPATQREHPDAAPPTKPES